MIEWPAEECKRDRPHVVPLEPGGTLDIVERLMAEGRTRLFCPYLFHGPRCAPGRRPSKLYGCVVNFKKAWQTACRKAGLPVGRKAGGFVFHHTRNSAVTNLVASGMDQGDAMKVTGHQTAATSFSTTTLVTSRRSATSSPSDGRTWLLGRTGARWSGCRYPREHDEAC